jgi:hypothetical protein
MPVTFDKLNSRIWLNTTLIATLALHLESWTCQTIPLHFYVLYGVPGLECSMLGYPMRSNQIGPCMICLVSRGFDVSLTLGYGFWLLLLSWYQQTERGHPKSPGLSGDYRTIKPVPVVLLNFHFGRGCLLTKPRCSTTLSSSLMTQRVDAATVIML